NGTRRSRVLEKLFAQEQGGGHSPSPAETLVAREEATMLRTALDKLPADQREAVLLHYAEDLPKKDVALRMGVHPSTAGRLLERALAGLKQELDPTLRE